MGAQSLNRRGFLRLAVGSATGAMLAACQPKIVEVEKVVEKEVTTVVKETVMVEGEVQVVEKVVTAAVAPKEPVTLNFMSRHDFDSQRLAVADWNEAHPEIQVKIDEVVGDTWDYYRIKMMQQLAAGNPPDCVFTDVWYFRLYAIDDVFLNLEPLIATDYDLRKEDLWPVVVQNCSSPDINGDMYCLPYDYGTHCLAYNKDMFDAAGATYPADNASWDDDILPLAQEFTLDFDGNKPGSSGFDPLRINQYGINPYNYLFWWFITTTGGQCFDEAFTKSTMNTPEGNDAIKFLYDLMNTYYVAPSPAYQQSQPVSFQTGKIAMSIVATWDIAGWNSTIDFEWDVVRPPRRSVSIGDGRASGMAILSETKFKAEAWEWIKDLSIGRGQHYKQLTGAAIHPMKDKARNDTFMKRETAPYNMEAFIQEADLGGGPPLFKGWHYYIDLAPAELSKAYIDDVSIEEALAAIDEKTDYVIANDKMP
ncbi:MAG: ABC transporter substrate-binding protein [Anaerolineae bacterium]